MRIIDGEEVYSTALAFRALTAAALAVFLSRFFRPSRLPFKRLAYACREFQNFIVHESTNPKSKEITPVPAQWLI
jgi:hypothetical protein